MNPPPNCSLYLRLLSQFRRCRFASRNKSRPNPDCTCAHHECGRKPSSIEDSTRRNKLHLFTRERRFVSSADIGRCRYQDACRYIAGMAASLSSLGADDIGASFAGFTDVLCVCQMLHP